LPWGFWTVMERGAEAEESYKWHSRRE
jgi:hypothetical protein